MSIRASPFHDHTKAQMRIEPAKASARRRNASPHSDDVDLVVLYGTLAGRATVILVPRTTDDGLVVCVILGSCLM